MIKLVYIYIYIFVAICLNLGKYNVFLRIKLSFYDILNSFLLLLYSNKQIKEIIRPCLVVISLHFKGKVAI